MLDRRQQAAETSAGGLVQEDPLDRLRGAEVERLLEGRFVDVPDL
jgi:hypothetical protein